MKILVLGAGAVGGYFGARLVQAGAEVAFLVRERRAAQLAEKGLVITGAGEELHVPVNAETSAASYPGCDLVILCCKAYDLGEAIESIAPAVNGETLVLPLGNGIAQFDALDARFGRARVLGGSCHLAAALEPDGAIRRFAELHRIVYGAREGNREGAREQLKVLHGFFTRTPVPAVLSTQIMQEVWEKYVMLCAVACTTCLMRAAVGDIVATERGRALSLELLDTCVRVAGRAGHPLSRAAVQGIAEWMTAPGSTFTTSMLRDIERRGPIESEHIVGDMLRRAEAAGVDAKLLAVAHCHLQAYEARRRRETR